MTMDDLLPFVSAADLSALTGTTVNSTDLITKIALDSACTSVRSYLGQTINLATTTESIDGRDRLTVRLHERPVRSVTSVTVDGEVLATTAWNLRGALLRRTDGGSFTLGVANVVVNYSHGYNIDTSDPNGVEVPADIRLVALLSARRVYTAVGTVSGAIQSETMGSYAYTLSTAVVVSTAAELLPAELAVLDRYRIGVTV
jgi:hypothetical protein